MRKESEKEYIYVQLNHYAVHQNLTQHCKSTISKKIKKEKKLEGRKLDRKSVV